MTERVSRLILAAEAVLLALPVTALAVYVAAMLVSGSLKSWSVASRPALVLMALCLVALSAGWYLIGAFLVSGAQRLRSLSSVWLLLPALGVVLVGIAAVAGVLAPNSGPLSPWQNEVVVLIFGAPAVVPYLHLLCERFLRVS